MNLLLAAFSLILGTIVGSFLSVVSYRLKTNKTLIFSRSICPHCKKKLKWKYLIPVFSWLFLKGKCGYCGKKISPHYLGLEILSGLVFLVVFLKWNFIHEISSTINPDFISYGIDYEILKIYIYTILEASFFLAIFFHDLMYKEIPDRLSIPAIILAIVAGLTLQVIPPLSMLIGGIGIMLFFLLQFILSKGKWIGGGDIRLGLLIGVFLGWKLGLLALIIAYVAGAILSIILLLTKKVNRKTEIPFGPFLILGTIISMYFGNQIIYTYLKTLTFLTS